MQVNSTNNSILFTTKNLIDKSNLQSSNICIASDNLKGTFSESTSVLTSYGRKNTNFFHDNNFFGEESAGSSFRNTGITDFTQINIKKEPIKSGELSTSNLISREQQNKSGYLTLQSILPIEERIFSRSDTMENQNSSLSQNSGISGIPIGIAFARQRLQDNSNITQPTKESNRFGLSHGGIDDGTYSVAPNILLADDSSSIIPSNTDNHIFGLSNIRPANSFWQYPIAIHESILPMSVPPIGFQIVRDPSTGNCICLPSTANNLDPFHPTVMWPTLAQTPSTTQVPHFMYPSVPQSLQAATFPPFQWMGTDYLSSTTLHQHTQTQTRLVAVPTDAKRKVNIGARIENQIYNHIPIKLEDRNEVQIECNTSAMSNFQSNTYSENKISTNSLSLRNIKETITTGVHTKNTSFNSFEKYTNNSILENTEPSPSSTLTQPSSSTLLTIQSNPPLITNEVVQVENKKNRSSINSECDMCICVANKQDAIIQTDTVCSEDIQNLDGENDFHNYGSSEPTTTGFNQESLYFDNEETKAVISFQPPINNNIDIAPIASHHENESLKFSFKPNNYDKILQDNVERASEAKAAPVDLSGLELLSNISIEAFENKEINFKQEVLEATSVNSSINDDIAIGQEPVIIDTPQVQKNIKEENKLEGLNLLCALAEQRIHEVSDTNEQPLQKLEKKRSKNRIVTKKGTFKKIKKHKLYSKKNMLNEDYGLLNEEINEMLTQVKSNYDNENIDGIQKTWPTPEQLIKAMEVNMRNRLAVISRKFQEKKKELEKITKKSYLKKIFSETSTDGFSCSLDSNTNTSASFQNSFILKSENMFKNLNVNGSSKLNEIDTNRSSNIELNKSNLFCNKKENDINPILSKNFADRNESFQNIEVDNITEQVQSPCKFQLSKSDLISKEDKLVVRLRKNSPDIFFMNDDNNKEHTKNKCMRKLMKRHPTFKKYKDLIKKKRKTENLEKRQKNMDNILKITKESLDQQKSRVLTAMGGLFYAGYLQPLEPPDVYSVTLDGERGNKPHIMCREEVLRDVILEVIPSSTKKVPPGTRICAYWSPQYRCLYPGTVVKPSDISNDNQYVSVEFDDGDSGKIVLEDIRFLLSDYPIVEYNINPLALLGKRKSNDLESGNMDIVQKNDEYHVNNNERCKHNKIRRDRYSVDSLQQTISLKHRQHSEDYCKHKKHKKKKKHKRHHRKKPLENIENKCEKLKEMRPETSIKQSSPVWEESTSNLDLNKSHNLEEMEDSSNSLSISPVSTISEKVENKTSKKNSENRNSKIAAFLPEKQLWGWLGTGVRRTGAKGRAKKICYKTIQRGKENITIGESAVFLSTGRPDRPYIGKIQSMWETPSSNKVVRVKWFYHPEETVSCPNLKYPGALFESPHEDENDVQTISHKCEVLPLKEYTEKFGLDPKQYDTIYFNNDTYYYAGFYDPTIQSMKLEQNIPTSDSN